MALIGIWSLAVYAAAAALTLLAARRWVLPIRPRVALLLAAAPLLFTGKATITGGVYAPLDNLYGTEPFAALRTASMTEARTPLLSDVVCSMIPWHKAVRDALIHGRLPLWNPFLLAGEPLLAAQQGAVLHPATWIGLLLPSAAGVDAPDEPAPARRPPRGLSPGARPRVQARRPPSSAPSPGDSPTSPSSGSGIP